jgi:hypothetical protein
MLQAYRTLIGSRIAIGIEFEFNGNIHHQTVLKFLKHIENHSMFMKYVIVHNMGYDGRTWSRHTHDLRDIENKREYRIQFDVKIGWGWCYLLEHILTCFIVLQMEVDSIHVHYNAIGDMYPNKTVTKVNKRVGKPTLNRIEGAKRLNYGNRIKKEAYKLYGKSSFVTTAYRYKSDESTQTLEIRCITPTVFYQQLIFEILYWEQIFKELQDGYRRTLKKDLILRKYFEYSTEFEESLGCRTLLRGPLLTRGVYNKVDTDTEQELCAEVVSVVRSSSNALVAPATYEEIRRTGQVHICNMCSSAIYGE